MNAKYLVLIVILVASIDSIAQDSKCYSLILKGASICNSSYKWNAIKVTASKEKLLEFIKTNKEIHSCNYLMKSEQDIMKDFKETDCLPEAIKIEFEDPKDVLQLAKVLREEKQGTKQSGNTSGKNPVDASTTLAAEPSSTEICINSNGEVSLSFSNEYGSIQVTSKGVFSVSAKRGEGVEYKIDFGN